ncbi:MAG: hypothetical protein WA139_03285 [Candidatus Aenigmatarchaeota archaeon]
MLPKITVFSGDISDAGAMFLVDSSNGYRLSGTGTSEQIRKHFGRIVDKKALHDYWNLVSEAKEPLSFALDYMHNVQKREPSVYQHKSLEYIVRERNSKPLRRGDAALLTLGDFAVSSAVGMTYDWKKLPSEKPLTVINATANTVKNSLQKSLVFAEGFKCGKVAMPIMCTRKGGLEKDESAGATASALKNHFSKYQDSKINEIIIVLYDEALQAEKEYFKGYFDSISE